LRPGRNEQLPLFLGYTTRSARLTAAVLGTSDHPVAGYRSFEPSRVEAAHRLELPAGLAVEDDAVFALPKSTFGPELDFHVQVDEPGLYKLWGQFRTAEGMEITVPFV